MTDIETYHAEPLLRARAIETQCYVIAAAQVGQHNEKRISYGNAMVSLCNMNGWCVSFQCLSTDYHLSRLSTHGEQY